MTRLLFFAVLVLSLMACNKEDDLVILPFEPIQEPNVPITKPDDTHPIRFSCAMMGQKSQYLRWNGENMYTAENTQTYAGDTLIWEIVAEDEGVYTIEEYFTAGSQLVVNPQPGDEYWFAEDTYTLEMTVANDSLFFRDSDGGEPTSRLLYWSLYEFPKQTVEGIEFEQDGWKMTIAGQDSGWITEEGKMSELNIENSSFSEVQVVINSDATAFDGPGYGFAYSTEYGFLRSYQWSAWTGTARGWDLFYQE